MWSLDQIDVPTTPLLYLRLRDDFRRGTRRIVKFGGMGRKFAVRLCPLNISETVPMKSYIVTPDTGAAQG